MPTSATTARSGSRPRGQPSETIDLATALAWLKAASSAAALAGMARYAIPSERAFGVAMRDVQAVAQRIGRRHDLAFALWDSGWYEARLLCAYTADPAQLTVAQMDRWCREFDNWAVCDTLCFALFDRTPLAWGRVKAWAASPHEYVKRGAFALLWGLTVHDKKAGDDAFLQALGWIEKAAFDERHFVKKAVNMALRATGKRNAVLKGAARAVAERLASSDDEAARWVGKDALRELGGAAAKKSAKKAAKKAPKKDSDAK